MVAHIISRMPTLYYRIPAEKNKEQITRKKEKAPFLLFV
jgi:hypothetical protein